MSKWMAKKVYKITLINQANLNELDAKEKVVWDTVVELADANHIKMPEI
ncbi:MAG: hypothetical protein LBD88_02975 [Candidatus Peribacteria bacterium]|nr:hypothetical protein [Candidatus Peribacteria bacterium]